MRTSSYGCPPFLASFYSQELFEIALPLLLRDCAGALLDVDHKRRGGVCGRGDASLVDAETVGEDDLRKRTSLGDDPVLVVGVVAWYDNPGAV